MTSKGLTSILNGNKESVVNIFVQKVLGTSRYLIIDETTNCELELAHKLKVKH